MCLQRTDIQRLEIVDNQHGLVEVLVARIDARTFQSILNPIEDELGE